MRAMVLTRQGAGALDVVERADPQPRSGEVLVRVHACGACRTALHIVDDERPAVRVPIVPGHEVIGTIEALGAGVSGLERGARVGIPWLACSCGTCEYCTTGRENLCERA